jgi:hypothetical protein
VSITIDTAGLELSNREEMNFKALFKWILYKAKSPNPDLRVRGNIVIPLSGNGTVGTCKIESFHEVVENGNGTGKSPQEHIPVKNSKTP